MSYLSLLNTYNVRSPIRTVLVSFGSEKPRAREFPVRFWPPQQHQINSSGTPFQTFCLMLLLYSYLYLNIIPTNRVNSHHLIKVFHQNFPKAEPRRFPRYCLHEMLRSNLFSLFYTSVWRPLLIVICICGGGGCQLFKTTFISVMAVCCALLKHSDKFQGREV